MVKTVIFQLEKFWFFFLKWTGNFFLLFGTFSFTFINRFRVLAEYLKEILNLQQYSIMLENFTPQFIHQMKWFIFLVVTFPWERMILPRFLKMARDHPSVCGWTVSSLIHVKWVSWNSLTLSPPLVISPPLRSGDGLSSSAPILLKERESKKHLGGKQRTWQIGVFLMDQLVRQLPPTRQWFTFHGPMPKSIVNGKERHFRQKLSGKKQQGEIQRPLTSRGGVEQRLFPWGNKLLPGGSSRMNIWQGDFPHNNTLEVSRPSKSDSRRMDLLGQLHVERFPQTNMESLTPAGTFGNGARTGLASLRELTHEILSVQIQGHGKCRREVLSSATNHIAIDIVWAQGQATLQIPRPIISAFGARELEWESKSQGSSHLSQRVTRTLFFSIGNAKDSCRFSFDLLCVRDPSSSFANRRFWMDWT